MTESVPDTSIQAHDPEEKLTFSYEGGGFPWFLRLIWIAFLTFAVVYTIKWFVPDLMAMLAATSCATPSSPTT